jgi:two-component system sensor histidine kinase SenX3
VELALILAGAALGLLIGLCVGFSRRAARHNSGTDDPLDASGLSPGVGQVLIVLRSLAIVLDESETVVKASPAAYAFGIVRAQRLVAEELVELVANTRRDGRIRQVDLQLPRGPVGDAVVPVGVRVAPLGAAHVLVLIEDQSDVRRLDAVRRDFVANVSHELKTPLGALRLLSEAVVHGAHDPEAVVRFADRMQHESQRLGQLVQELIDLSRLESHDPMKEPEEVSLDTVVAAGFDRTREVAAAKHISFSSDGESGLAVLGNPDQLVMALGNLIENAVNYSAESTRVVVRMRRRGALAEIDVVDQGIGIPAAEQERIFERFYRVDPARSRMTGGTGLGLSIVKHIARNHGGDVRVVSHEGVGSTFTLRVPLLSPTSETVRRPVRPATQVRRPVEQRTL